MRAWFTAMAPTRIWIPHFICPEALAAATGVAPVKRYALADDLGPASDDVPESGDVTVLVDYAGLCSSRLRQALGRLDPERTLVDASQSLFFSVQDARHIVYSPRKYVGVPDGGYLVTPHAVAAPHAADEDASLRRMEHLLLRLAGRRKQGLTAYRRSEASLDDPGPDGMSTVTRGLLASVDFGRVADLRRSNYDILKQFLGEPPSPYGPGSGAEVPLCFPYRVAHAAEARERLREKSIFVPHYWPGIALPEADGLAREMASSILCLPCDQRYDASSMEAMAQAVTSVAAILS
jgi:hypothetical protein